MTAHKLILCICLHSSSALRMNVLHENAVSFQLHVLLFIFFSYQFSFNCTKPTQKRHSQNCVCCFIPFNKHKCFCNCWNSINGRELWLRHWSGTGDVQEERHWFTRTLTRFHWITSPEHGYGKWLGRPISYFNRLKLLKYMCNCFFSFLLKCWCFRKVFISCLF